ncbi:hypothetical protein MtrunA17_Chr8g0358931 [Medicago truncatula]|uniref:Uncharacterized protein n=1 Tax=Medicago truncatula TaxID=3880 RepID=A0A396GKV6_MEDTR|nr:hypothetical protein MtrunA17_Chr8g0358931 [Medicago truncatula]
MYRSVKIKILLSKSVSLKKSNTIRHGYGIYLPWMISLTVSYEHIYVLNPLEFHFFLNLICEPLCLYFLPLNDSKLLCHSHLLLPLLKIHVS